MATVVQHTYAVGSASAAPALTGVTAGNTLIAGYVQVGSVNPTPTYTASSSIDGSMGSDLAAYNPGGTAGSKVGGFRLDEVSAGDHTVTVTASNGGVNVHVWLFEVSGLEVGGTVVLPTGNGYQDGANTDNHDSAPSGEIDAPAGFFVTVNALSGDVTTLSAGSGYTKATDASGTVRAFCQYKVSASAVTDDRGSWTSVGTDRISTGTILAFPNDGDAPAPGAFVTGGWFGR